MHRGEASRFKWMFGVLGVLPLAGLLFAGCGEEQLEPRRGLVGDSCTRTDDCEVPLRCIKNECVAPAPSGGFDGGLPDGFGPGPGPSASEGPWSQCDECLEGQCGAQEKACGSDCLAIEACIESTCVHLSETGSQDEGECFVSCQNRFPDGKSQHVALVNCATKHTCSPPCTFYPQDYDLCRMFMNNGDCAGYKAYCESVPECSAYRDCIAVCASIEDCLACDDTPAGSKGKAILESYEKCIASECLVESWMP